MFEWHYEPFPLRLKPNYEHCLKDDLHQGGSLVLSERCPRELLDCNPRGPWFCGLDCSKWVGGSSPSTFLSTGRHCSPSQGWTKCMWI